MPKKTGRLKPSELKIPPVGELLGFRLVKARGGTAVCTMEARKKHLNMIGSVHGGMLCDLSDAAMGFAFTSLLAYGQIGVTVEFKINFFQPVYVRDKLVAVARTISRGKSLSYLECEIRNSKAQLVAKAASTCKVIFSPR